MAYVTTSGISRNVFCKNPETSVRQLQVRRYIKRYQDNGLVAVYNLRQVASDLQMRPSVFIDHINEFVEFRPTDLRPDPPKARKKTVQVEDTADYFLCNHSNVSLSYAIQNVIHKYVLCHQCQGLSGLCGCPNEIMSQKNTTCECDKCDLIVLGTRTVCCWCSDHRSDEEIINIEIRLDAHGFVAPRKYHMYWPIDAAYCVECRKCPPTTVLYGTLSSAVTAARFFEK